ncbi:hypothetical protein A2U01_0099690, partial [Trifolium medium]|nr:hypothetical protein [Trifolium medium]
VHFFDVYGLEKAPLSERAVEGKELDIFAA